eukprot:m51a1_g10768 putative protein kinase like protein (954) ;mRNA; f:34577-38607
MSGTQGLQSFLDAVVSGRLQVSHTIDPSEITKTPVKLGSGACASVFKALYKGTSVAMKVFSEDNLAFNELEIRREAALLSVIDHPNLVRYVGACLRAPQFFVVTELYPTNLQHVIEAAGQALATPVLLRIAMGIAYGMRFLHSLGIIHRDLKTSNVLLTEKLDAKISDFGTARIVPGNHRMMTGGIGTAEFMAPEVMSHEIYSKKADVYSFAVVLWCMFARSHPYPDLPALAVAQYVTGGSRPSLPEGIMPKMALLIRSCWHQKPKYRPDFTEIADCHSRLRAAGVGMDKVGEMQGGSVMLKCGRKGRPHFALFQLSDDLRYIMWTSRKKDPAETKLKLSRVRELTIGQQTTVFQRAGLSGYETLSFSLVHLEGTLDIVATNNQEYHTWVTGLRALVPAKAIVRTHSTGPYDGSELSTDSAATECSSLSYDKRATRDAAALSSTMGASPAVLFSSYLKPFLFPCMSADADEGPVRRHENKVVYLWPVGNVGLFPDTRPSPVLIESLLGKDVEDASCGSKHYAVVTLGGDLYTWGDNKHGQLGQFFKVPPYKDDDVEQPQPHIVPFGGNKVSAVACGKYHTLCITSEGALFAWGKNSRGQLGIGSFEGRSTPSRVADLWGTQISIVACGPHNSAAYSCAGQLYMWGRNDTYQLGLGHTKVTLQPAHVAAPFSQMPCADTPCAIDLASQLDSVSLGMYHSAAKTKTGTVFLWGKLGEADSEPVPKATIFGDSFAAVQMSCGLSHIAVLADNGLVYTWGDGRCGQLGHGMFEVMCFKPQPVAAGQLSKYKPVQVSCGPCYTAVLTSTGNIYAFGVGSTGTLQPELEAEPTLLKALCSKRVVKAVCGPTAVVAVSMQRRTPDSRLAAWVPNCEAPLCMACNEPAQGTPRERSFTLVTEHTLCDTQHHCRKCEGVFCSECSQWRAPILDKGFPDAVRVCLHCYSLLTASPSLGLNGNV